MDFPQQLHSMNCNLQYSALTELSVTAWLHCSLHIYMSAAVLVAVIFISFCYFDYFVIVVAAPVVFIVVCCCFGLFD